MKKLKIVLLQNRYTILVLLSVLFAFIFYGSYHSKLKGNEKEIIGYIRKITIDGDKLSLIIKTKENMIVNYYFKSEKEKDNLDLELNDEVKVSGSIKEPNNNTVLNTFNYRDYLYSKKIFYIFNAKKIGLINKNNNIYYSIKNHIFSKTNNLLSKEYINAFILGDKTDISSSEYEIYKNLGIIHIFSISGMHISFIILILKRIKTNNIITILFLIFYLLLIGPQVSVIRSIFMFILSVFINNIKKIDLLKICFSIMLIINPLYLYDIGFIFTFIITYGIYYFKDILNKNYLLNLIIISIITFLCSLPIVINTNYSVNVLSILINIIYIPIFTFVIFPLSIITFFVPVFDSVLANIMNIFKNISFIINEYTSTISFSKIPVYFYIIYYALLFNKNIRVKIILIILIIFFYFYNYYLFNSYIYYLDVGQGDSSLIRINNKNVLIDTGGKTEYVKEEWQKKKHNYNLIDNSILFFKSIGIKKIDYLILTHGDYDHMGEAINLVNNFKVDKVIFNCGEYNDLEKELIKVLDKKRIKYYSCIKELNIDNNKLYFLQTKEYDNENDNSNVIYIEQNGYKFMFMGDASVTTEKEIMNKYNLPNIDVLKVGHHGSKTSSGKEFINEINPKYSIISVGKNNRYGHPNKEVLDNLNNSKIYRTDENGSIMFKIKNNKLRIDYCEP
ncbi:MAG: DNA internalization-related competence protein ComEC/Rec2 [Bacilli bacterium]|nr:DNA internalization-related competence protein ComEC/Rec2 [Bacilli bacterium]